MSVGKILEGTSVIVTGASSGIGKAIALGFTDMGAKVGMIGRREDNLKEIQAEIMKKGGVAEYATADTTNFDGLKKALDTLTQKFGNVDGLINNAGVSEDSMFFHEQSKKAIDQVIDTNLKGVMYGTMIMLPHFVSNRKGAIVNTSSLVTVEHLRLACMYTTSKHAVNGFTKHIAEDYKENKVTSNAVLPGWTESEMTNNPRVKAILDMMGITLTPAERLVPLYAFFFTKAARRATGTLVNVDHTLQAWDFAKTLPKTPPPTWESVEPLLKEKFNAVDFNMVGKCKTMMNYLFSLP